MSIRSAALGTVLRGVGVSPGIVSGKASRLDRTEIPIERVHLPDSLLEAEMHRVIEAVERAEAEIDALENSLQGNGLDGEHLAVLSAHKMMLRDPMLLSETKRLIDEQGINAEWAVSEAVHHIHEIFDSMQDPFFRERGEDVDHVGDLLLRSLSHDGDMEPVIGDVRRGAIVVAERLSPAEALSLARLPVGAFVLSEGTTTSHTAIIASSMDIPSVVGVIGVTEHVGDGDQIIVDGVEGEIVVHPTEEEQILYSRRERRARAFFRALRQNRQQPATTQDEQVTLTLRGNLDIVDEVGRITRSGGEGIGLFRTEFLFLERTELPSEEEQFQVYKEIITQMSPASVTIRTLDVGGDKLLKAPGLTPPSQSLRAIRSCLKERGLFATQLRALLRASVHGNLRILLPFVTTVSEVRATKAIIAQVRDELTTSGVPHGEIPLGVMIEVPAAALIAEQLAAEVDFFSVGTNDLIQFTLAVARDEPQIEYLHQPLHPGLLNVLEMVVQAAGRHDCSVSMCGEMAGMPQYTLVLLALGFQELSMNAASIPLVKEVIRRSSLEQARKLLNQARALGTVEEITDYVDSYMVQNFPDIVSPKMRGAPRHGHV